MDHSHGKRPVSAGFGAYLSVVAALGLVSLCLAIWHVVARQVPAQWWIIATLAVFAGSVAVRVPDVRPKVSLSETLIFTNAVLFGPAAGTLTAAVDGLMGSFRVRTNSRHLRFALFNSATMVLSASLSGFAFFRILGQGPLSREPVGDVWRLLSGLLVLALTAYAVNTGLVAGVMALESRKPFFSTWRDNYLWVAASYFGGATLAGIIALNSHSMGAAQLAYIFPFLFLTYFMYRANQDEVSRSLHNQELDRLYLKTVEALAMAIDAKDHATQGHANRVLVLSRGLARAVGMTDPNELRAVEAAALLHDVGNLAVPEYILNKPGKLTPAEFERMKVHPVVGARILGAIPFPYPVTSYVRHHHERWDGSGYPDALKGDRIPLGSRVLAVVDAYEALTVDRPYQAACKPDRALEIIRSFAGTRFDPYVVQRFEAALAALLRELPEPGAQKPAPPGETQEPSVGMKLLDFQPFSDINRTQKEVAALFELARNLGTSLNLKETLALLASAIAKLVPFTTCAVYLRRESAGTLSVVYVSGENQDAFTGYGVPLGERLSGRVFVHKTPVVNVDPSPEIDPVKHLLQVPLDYALIFPLALNGEVLGVIALYSGAHKQFQEDHVRLMEIVAGQAANAVQNALQFEETLEGAFTDSLTGLPNARFFNPHFEQELKRAERYGQPIGVLVMDLDGFKNINDRFGHRAGDKVLIEVAQVLKQETRETDVVVRWRGDEFVAVLPQSTCSDAQVLASRIRTAMDELRVNLGEGKQASVGISVGVSCYPDDGDTPEALIEEADRAMYRDKRSRKGYNGAEWSTYPNSS